MFLLSRPAGDVNSKDSRMKGFFHFVDESLLLKAEGEMEYVVSCKGKSKFCEEQVQDQKISSDPVY